MKFHALILSLYFSSFFVLGGVIPFWGVYLNSIHFNIIVLAFVTATIPLSRIFVPLIRSGIMYRHGTKHVILICALISFLFMTLQLFYQNFIVCFISTLIFSLTWYTIIPLIDADSIEFSILNHFSYAKLRVWGSIGFLTGALFFGEAIKISHNAYIIAIILSIVITGLLIYYNYPISVHDFDKNIMKISFFNFLLADKTSLFVVSSIVLQISFGAYYGFYSLYLLSHGYSTFSIGALWCVAIISEILFLFFVNVKPEIQKYLLVMAFTLSALRWFIISYSTLLIFIILAQIAHAVTFAPFHVSSIKIIRNSYPAHLREQSQVMYSALVYGAGIGIGVVISGEVWIKYSPSSAFLVACLIAIFALTLLILALREIDC
ncbi:MFS transporter [Acidithiobacillus ferrianus]|uniref:MFS transporter n=1 Tax=Acidithiobacillus ferrianus TaxID=2678518 RepID=UPI0034E38126